MSAEASDKVVLHRSDASTKLSIPRKLAFGVGGAASVVPSVIIGFYLQIFLLETAQLSPTYASIVIFSGKLWDAITDPLVGFFSSRTESRWGRMRPWLLFSTVPMAMAYVSIWFVPSSDQGILTMYYLLTYCAFQTLLSCYHVPYTALTVYVSTDSSERDSATAYRMTCEVLGTVVGAVLQGLCITFFVEGRSDDCSETGKDLPDVIRLEKKAYVYGSIIAGIIMIIVGFSPFFGVREKRDSAVKREPLGFFQGLRYALKQRPFVDLMLAYLCAWLMIAITQANLALYAQYVAKNLGDDFQNIIIVLLCTAALAIPLWQFVILKFGKKVAFVAGMSFHFPALLLLLYLQPSFSDSLWGMAVISGIGTGAAFLAPWSMLPDVIDDVAVRDGVRRESLFYAFFVFFTKFASGIALGLSTLALEVFGGYETGKCEQPDSVAMTLRLLISALPFVLILLSFLFVWRYPIDEARRWQNKEKLERKRRNTAISERGATVENGAPKSENSGENENSGYFASSEVSPLSSHRSDYGGTQN